MEGARKVRVGFRDRVLILLWVWVLGIAGCSGGMRTQEETFQVAFLFEGKKPKLGENRLRLEVRSKEGVVLEKADIRVLPEMPAHGHGSTQKAVVTEVGKGVYEAYPVTLHMAGEWEILVEIAAAGKIGKATERFVVE